MNKNQIIFTLLLAPIVVILGMFGWFCINVGATPLDYWDLILTIAGYIFLVVVISWVFDSYVELGKKGA